MGKGWIDENGEYCESYSETIFPSIKEQKEANKNWFNSLPIAQQEIMKVCRNTKNAYYAHAREMALDSFYRKITGNSFVPKKDEKYKFAFDRIGEFKTFIEKWDWN